MLQSEAEGKLYKVIRSVFGVLTHFLSLGFTVFVAVISQPGSSLFSWHPFLMTLAFTFLMTEAILLFSPHSSPVSRLKHQTKSRLHWFLQASSACCAVLGLAAIAYNKHLNGKPHFTTWHGSVGAPAVAAVLVQAVAALPLLYHKLARGWSLAKLKRYHAAAGLLVYLLGSAGVLLGTWSGWYVARVDGYAWYLTALCPAIAALVIMSQVSDAYVAKKRLQS